jgi:hypothetical protein
MVFDDSVEQALSELRQLGLTHIFNVKVATKVYGGNSEVYFANLCSACIEQAFRTYQLGRMQAIAQTHVIVSTLVNNATNVVKSPSGSPVYDDKNQWNFAMAAAKVAMLRLYHKPESKVQANVREENVIAEMMDTCTIQACLRVSALLRRGMSRTSFPSSGSIFEVLC